MNNQKILIIQTAFLGDAVLTLPMIQVLKEKFPGSSIDVLAIPSTAELFKTSPFVDDVFIFDKKGKDKSIFSLFETASRLRANKYDRIYSPHKSFRTALIVKLSRVKETFGFDKSSAAFFYKNKIKYNSAVHEVGRNLELAGHEIRKESDWKILPLVELSTASEDKINSLLLNLPSAKFIAVAPGSVWNTKVYPKEYFEKVIESLTARGFFVLLIGGAADKNLCRDIENKFSGKSKSFAGELTATESVSLLKHCRLLISNDSAPTHLGMAAGIPVLTIFCSTVPEFGFYPYNNGAHVSLDGLSCKPCGIHGRKICPIKTFDCAYKLYPEIVIKQVDSLLNLG